MDRFKSLSVLVLLVACGPGDPGDVTGGASSGGAGTASSDGVTDGTADPTSMPMTGTSTTTSGVPTTGAPEPVETTAATTTTGATSTTDTGSESSTGLPYGECAEPFRQWDWNKPLHADCLVDWPTTTMIHGEGAAAGLAPVTRVFFGVGYAACHEGLQLLAIVLADPFDPVARLYGVEECGPELWLGESERAGELAGSETPIAVTLNIDGFTGDWTSIDPVDPPRLFGSVAGDLVGLFEAVHCAALDEVSDRCG